MYRRALSLLVALMAASVCLIAAADAAGYRPAVRTLEQASGVIYYHNGTAACGPVQGILSVDNPSASCPLSGVNVTLPDGSTVFVGTIGPSSSYSAGYSLAPGGSTIPLRLKETIIPSTLTAGVPGQLRLCVEMENGGSRNITGAPDARGILPWTTGTTPCPRTLSRHRTRSLIL